MSLVSRKRVKGYLGLALDECEHDYFLDYCIELADALVERVYGFPIAQASQTLFFSGHGHRSFLLPWYRVVSITTVHEVDCDDGSLEEIDAAEYRLQEFGGGWLLVRSTPHGVWNRCADYKLVAVAGFSTLPSEIEHAGLVAAAMIAKRSGVATIGRDRLGVARHAEKVDVTVQAAATALPIGSAELKEIEDVVEPLVAQYRVRPRALGGFF